MKILPGRLTATPSALRFEAGPAFWEGARSLADAESAVVEPLAFEIQAYVIGEDLYLEGLARGGLELECARCLARYRHAIREPFRLVLEPAGDRVPLEPEGVAALARNGICLSDEVEAGWFGGSEIDLTAFLAEVVALALPVQPLCSEDCRGLCPHCGTDRNTQVCSCEEDQTQSPFAALRVLRGGQVGGSS